MFFSEYSQTTLMANRTDNRKSTGKRISASYYTRTYISKISKKIKDNPIFRFLNKEEDEDNDQTFWPFTSNGRLSLSRLS
jgi:hypothetical protein